MNRHWSVALVIVVLAALAPSAALGAAPPKPADEIISIEWTALASTAGTCQSAATVTFTVARGPERMIEAAVVLANATSLGNITFAVPAGRGGTDTIAPIPYPMGTTQYKLGVQIISRKGVVFPPVFTEPYMGCGAADDPLGSFPDNPES